MKTLLLAIALASAAPAWSVEIERLTIQREGRHFQTDAVFFVDLPRERVIQAATNFERLADINPAVVSTHVAPMPSGEIRLTTTLRDCVSAVCRTVVLVEDVAHAGDDRLISRVVPDAGDFASGHATWHFQALGSRTRVHYQGQIRPDFWVPRLIGSSAFKRSLRRQVTAAALRLETLSREST